jgi:hypothetical protein
MCKKTYTNYKIYQCDNCGKDVPRRVYDADIERISHIYCSKACVYEHRGKVDKWKDDIEDIGNCNYSTLPPKICATKLNIDSCLICPLPMCIEELPRTRQRAPAFAMVELLTST